MQKSQKMDKPTTESPHFVMCGPSLHFSDNLNASYDISFSNNVFFSSNIAFCKDVLFCHVLRHKHHCIFNRELPPDMFKDYMNQILEIMPRPDAECPSLKEYWASITQRQWTQLAFLPGFDGALVNDIISVYIPEIDFGSLRNIACLAMLSSMGITVELPDE